MSLKFCPHCGAQTAQRKWDPLQVAFLYCHCCGQPTSCALRPTVHGSTQTPQEWAAFPSTIARDSMLSDMLEGFAERAASALRSADIRDDFDHQFSFSPKTARDKVREIVRSHEEALLQLRRVHDAEVRTLRSRLAVAESVNAELTEKVQRLEAAASRHDVVLQSREDALNDARRDAVSETERKWKAIIDKDAAGRSEREAEVVAAWRMLYNSLIPSKAN